MVTTYYTSLLVYIQPTNDLVTHELYGAMRCRYLAMVVPPFAAKATDVHLAYHQQGQDGDHDTNLRAGSMAVVRNYQQAPLTKHYTGINAPTHTHIFT